MENKFPISIRLVIGFLGVFAFLIFLSVAKDILIPVTLSVLLSLVLYPFCLKVERWGVSRTWSVVWVMVAAFLLMAIVLGVLVTQFLALGRDLPELTLKLNERIKEWSEWAQATFGMDQSELLETVEKSTSSLVSTGGSFISDFVGSAGQAITVLSLIPFMVFLILVGRRQFMSALHAMVRPDHREDLATITGNVREMLKSYMGGLVIVMLIIGVLNSLGLWMLGIPYPLFFGLMAALLTIFPYIGNIIGSFLPIVMALLTKEDGHWYALGVVGVFGTVQFLEGYFLTPRIIGGKVSVNPLAAIIALMVGGMIWGMVGIILALPLAAILKLTADEIEALKPLAILLGEGDSKIQKSEGVKTPKVRKPRSNKAK